MTRISRVLFLGSVVLTLHYPLVHRRAGYPGFSRLHDRWKHAAAVRRTTGSAACTGVRKVQVSVTGRRYPTHCQKGTLRPQCFPSRSD